MTRRSTSLTAFTDVSLPELPSAAQRVPLEHAVALDSICTTVPATESVYVETTSPPLLQAVINRHDTIVVSGIDTTDVFVPEETDLRVASNVAEIPETIDRVLLLEPATPSTIEEYIDAVDAQRHDCVVANPFSYNQIDDRAMSEWCSPLAARRAYADRGFDTEVNGYHGPRSILNSVFGRLWAVGNRPEKRDQYTHRMRAVYRESARPLALLSCLVHITATRWDR